MKKNLTKLLLVLFGMLAFNQLKAEDITVYFDNTGNWSNLRIWAWEDGGKNQLCENGWPGDEMSSLGGKRYYYKIKDYDSSKTLKAIFVNKDNEGQRNEVTITGNNLVYNATSENGSEFAWYLCADFTTWDVTNNSYKLNYDSTDDCWKINNVPNFSGNFKIWDGTTDNGKWVTAFAKIDNNSFPTFDTAFANGNWYQCTKGNEAAIYYSGDKKTVNITVNPANYQILVEEVPQISDWVVVADFSANNEKNENRTVELMEDASKNFWSATFEAQAEDGWSQFAVKDTKNNIYYYLNDLTLSELSTKSLSPLVPYSTNNRDWSHFRLTPGNTYTIKWYPDTKMVELSFSHEITYPTTMNVAGQVNGKSEWDASNVVPMQETETGSHVFIARNVEISQDDLMVNFCSGIGSNAADWNGQRPQFGYDSNESITVENSDPLKIKEINAEPKSFKLKKGFYDITVDLNEMTASFNSKEKKELTWQNGSVNINGPSHTAVHRVNNIYDLHPENGIKDEHIKISVTKNATSSLMTLANEETDDYAIDGNMVTLKKAGNYTLSASIEDNDEYFADPKQLTVTLEPLNLSVSLSDTDNEQAWSKDKNTVTLTTIDDSSADISEDDFTITVTPKFTDLTEQPESWSKEDTGMYEYQWNQMISIMSGTDYTNNVDGFYYPVSTTDVLEFSNGALSANIQFPCSGQYEITLTSNDPDIVLANNTPTVTIYPNYQLTYDYTLRSYGKDSDGKPNPAKTLTNDGMTINGIQLGENNTIKYPYMDNKLYGDVSEAEIIFPGIYRLEGIYYSVTTSESTPPAEDVEQIPEEDNNLSKVNAPRKAAPSGMQPATDGNLLDLSALEDSNISVNLVLEKNGVSSKEFTINISRDNSIDVPTGIEAIGAEGDGEVEFYNLQGVKVANPDRGIYIKVVNGKASKVIL